MSTHSDERTGDVGFRVIHRAGDPIPSDGLEYHARGRAVDIPFPDAESEERARRQAQAIVSGPMLPVEDYGPDDDIMSAAASSIVRMDAAEAAADALSKYAHLLPDWAYREVQETARAWRILRGL